ncbi:hypothetical protein KSP39_PZI000454 [Platanthera zijinensis]|uniref:FAD dependent oxidoreductase domain-containing protein n=1 Tax=Platanthera zijinensis TaxID=2320716 RepID=A0AAP0C481_9ASPA
MASEASSAAPATACGVDEASRRRVIICGGGVIGACTAYFLASKAAGRVAITVVEKSAIACAASGKAGGFLALDWCDGTPVADLARASFLLHRSLSDLLDGPRTYGYRALTTLSLALSPSELPRSRSPALPSWIDGAAASRPRTIGTPETTAQVQSVDVSGGGAGVVLRDGRILPADAVVIALGPWSSRLRLVSALFHISGLKAHSIILRPPQPDAISPHALFLSYQPTPSSKILDPEVYPRPTGTLNNHIYFTSSPFLETFEAVTNKKNIPQKRKKLLKTELVKMEIMHSSIAIFVVLDGFIDARQVLVERTGRAVPSGNECTWKMKRMNWRDNGFQEFFIRLKREVYICGLSKEATPPNNPEEIAAEPESIAMLHQIAGAVSSHLKSGAAEVVAEQACFLPCTDDSLPVIGEIPGAENIYVATGHSCWGILNGPATGAALAELILEGRSTTVDLEPFNPARFLRRKAFT